MDTKALGKRVRSARVKQIPKMTQAALAHAVGVQLLTISNIERGVTESPKSGTIAKIAGVLGVSTDSLVKGEGDAPAPVPQAPSIPAEYYEWRETMAPPDVRPYEAMTLESMAFDDSVPHPGVAFYQTVLAGMRAGISAAEMHRGIAFTAKVRAGAARKKREAAVKKGRRAH